MANSRPHFHDIEAIELLMKNRLYDKAAINISRCLKNPKTSNRFSLNKLEHRKRELNYLLKKCQNEIDRLTQATNHNKPADHLPKSSTPPSLKGSAKFSLFHTAEMNEAKTLDASFSETAMSPEATMTNNNNLITSKTLLDTREASYDIKQPIFSRVKRKLDLFIGDDEFEDEDDGLMLHKKARLNPKQ